MPLLLRTVDPSHVARGTLPERFPVQNDLEAVSNGTLSNVIRQLSSLSHHADELFTDLIGVASGIAHRAGNLQARIDRLAVRVGQIDAVQEESASIHESLNTKPFTSSLVFDQQVVARSSLPPSMLKTFQLCDMPPPLDKLNKYRDDGRNGLKFYTDPSYFFDLWRQEMIKDTERAIDRGKKPHKLKHDGQNRHKKRVRQPHNTRERQRHLAIQQGEHLMGGSVSPDLRNQQQTNSIGVESHDGSNNTTYQSPPDSRASYAIVRGSSIELEDQREQLNNRAMSLQQQQRQQYEVYQRYYASQNQNYESPNYNNRNNRNTPVNGYRPSQPPPAPPPSYVMSTTPQGTPTMHTPPNMPNNRMSSALRSNHRETLPPPPPPPIDATMFPQPEEEDLPPPPPTPMEHMILRPPSLPEEHLPPSPPPPPLDDIPRGNLAPPPPPPPPPGVPQLAQNGDTGVVMLTKNIAPKSRKNVTSELRDGRDELLKAIRDGIALRKVETTNGTKVEEKSSTYHDVASILARRVAVEMSDSDSGSSEYDSDGWDEASA